MSDCKTCGGTGRTSTVVKVGLFYNFGKPTDDQDTTVSGRCPSCSAAPDIYVSGNANSEADLSKPNTADRTSSVLGNDKLGADLAKPNKDIR